MNKHFFSEKGQILVLLALVLIGLLGFTALAVDGGMIFADRRYMQSSADAASLAGAGDIASVVEAQKLTSINCSALAGGITHAYATTINTAASNDFTIAHENNLGPEPDEVNNGVKIICNESVDYVDVVVMLTRDTTTSFVHLFTGGPMRNTVYSKTRVQPRTTAGDGSSIVSLSKDCIKNHEGGFFSGNNTTVLTNGGIWSNSCIVKGGNAGVTITGGAINYYDCGDPNICKVVNLSNPIPTPQYVYHPMTVDPFSTWTWDCNAPAHAPTLDSVTGITTYAPGTYSDWSMQGVKAFLEPGLYCLSGPLNSNASTEIEGKDITIYFTGDKFQVNAQAKLNLAAPNPSTLPPLPDGSIMNLLFYAPTASEVTINGGSDNYIGGTMYMPQALVTINGNSGTRNLPAWDVAIIGYGVKILGNSTIELNYNPDLDFGFPAFIQVQK